MPNWCDNYIHLEGPSEEVKKLQEDFSSKGMLETLSPIGEWEYMTAVNTWGTKWEISEDEVQHFEFYQDGHDWAHLSGPFQSAWSPPAEAVRTFLDNNPDFTATLMFYEPAMDFAGTLDESVTISDKSDDYWIMDPDGIELNEAFGILESRLEWAAEEEQFVLEKAEDLEPIEKEHYEQN